MVRTAGFTLIEVLVATAVAMAAVAALAQVFVVSAHVTSTGREVSVRMALAEQKLQQLRGEAPWLQATPAGTLEADTPGYFDRVDRSGSEAGLHAPGTDVYVRRWSVASLPGSPAGALLVRVTVRPALGPPGLGPAGESVFDVLAGAP